jgi:5-formyltetrahydrofolate cyclo-ligase
MNLSEQKRALRARVLSERETMTAPQRQAASTALTERLAASAEFRKADSVLAYWGFGSEVDTRAFLKAVLAAGKMLALPRIEKATQGLSLYQVHNLENDLADGPWGIREPKPLTQNLVGLEQIGFVLVPGVAFDAKCNRMGYGKAYYDRLFADCKAPLPHRVAAAFDCQIVDAVPVSPSDVPIDAVITPTRIFEKTPLSTS